MRAVGILQEEYDSARERLSGEIQNMQSQRGTVSDEIWLQRRRVVGRDVRETLRRRQREQEAARENLLDASHVIQSRFPDFADILPWADFAKEAMAQATQVRRARQAALAATAPAAAGAASSPVNSASSQVARGAMLRYRQWFADAAGRSVSEGPPGVACEQPAPPPQFLSMDDVDWARWWLQKGGYARAEQLDDNGWTPLHHAMLATAHWDYAHRVCRGLIRMMSRRWLDVQTRGDRPAGYTALHMACNGSDSKLVRPDLVRLLIEAEADLEARNPHGAIAFLLAAGTGVVDAAWALSQAGADVHAVGNCHRNAADRCAGSSGTMQRCGYV